MIQNDLKYHEVINYFIKRYRMSSYIELGVATRSATFDNVIIEEKEGVDIAPIPGIHHMTTDEYFATIGKEKRFDIALVDADHHKTAMVKDVLNCLDRLKDEKSVILTDDIFPEEEWLLSETYCGSAWQGWAELGKRDDLMIHQIKGTRFGFIRKGKQIPHKLDIIPTFQFLQDNKDILMRQIDFAQIDEVLDFEDKTGEAFK